MAYPLLLAQFHKGRFVSCAILIREEKTDDGFSLVYLTGDGKLRTEEFEGREGTVIDPDLVGLDVWHRGEAYKDWTPIDAL